MLRQATIADIPNMIALQDAVKDEGVLRSYVVDSVETWNSRDLSRTYVSEEGSDLCGFIYCAPRPHAGENSFPRNARMLEIVELLVYPHVRHQGHGSALMESAEKHARSEGFTHLRLFSMTMRFDDIISFYRSHGFQPWYVEMAKEL